MNVYYNDNDSYVCEWLRNLIAAGYLPTGDVDERPIEEVSADDLEGYDQCHFFAGIGGWPLALDLAQWDRPVWTGSCPCQPFSAAGQGQAEDDPRHLWPQWLRLVRKCRPDTIFGEQVEGAVGHGWIDRVFADLENEDYTCGAAVLGAHSVGAPHIRQRLWWVADATRPPSARQRQQPLDLSGPANGGGSGRLAIPDGWDARAEGLQRSGKHGQQPQDGGTGGLGNAPGGRRFGNGGTQRSFWSSATHIPCADGKARRIGPSIQLLAHGVPARVGKLRAAGNAIVPQVAAEFVTAYMNTAARSFSPTSPAPVMRSGPVKAAGAGRS